MARTPHPGLLALTSSALLLPAYQAQGDSAPDNATMGLRYSEYKEDDLSAGDTFGGNGERYEIDVSQFHLTAPVGSNWSFAFDVQKETMSGASPWFIGQSAGEPRVIMSGASIYDSRTSVSLATRYYFDNGNAGIVYTNSDEDDYESDALGVDYSINSEDGSRTYTLGASVSRDDLEPTQGSTPTSTLSAEKDSRSAYIGMTQIISRRSIAQFGLSYTYHEGFLSDPYKGVDNRPDERRQWVFSTRYRHHFMDAGGTLHADYRYFDDDWGVSSHTLDFAWYQPLGDHFKLIPSLRYYTQEEADFFDVNADSSARYYADDHRLSAFGAWTAGLKLQATVRNWTFTLSGERYSSDNSYGVFGGDESPALLDFERYTVGIDYRFD